MEQRKKLSEETKQKLSKKIKGKTYEERYGKEKAEEIKNKIKKSLTGIKRAKGKKTFRRDKTKNISCSQRKTTFQRME